MYAKREFEEKVKTGTIHNVNQYIKAIIIGTHDTNIDYGNDTDTMTISRIFNHCEKLNIPFFFGKRGNPQTQIHNKDELYDKMSELNPDHDSDEDEDSITVESVNPILKRYIRP